MKVFHDDGAQWLDIAEPVAPISLRDLRATSALAANFSDRSEFLIHWACASITEWNVRSAYGDQTLTGKPTADAFLDLSFAQQKWIFNLLFQAAVEIPLVSAPPLPNGSTPAAVA